MKTLLLVTVVGGALMSSNVQSPPLVHMASTPLTIKPEPIVIIPAAIAVGVGVGIVGWAGIKVLNGMLRAWEHKITNGAPDDVVFTFAEDEYPE
jgi:hypothetical protein